MVSPNCPVRVFKRYRRRFSLTSGFMAEKPMTGKTIRLYLVDGVATGVLTAEIINWTGKVIVAPALSSPP